MKFLILILGILASKVCYGLICYTCSSQANANCRETLLDLTKIETTECSGDINTCAVFYDSSTKSFFRGCSDQFFIQGLNYEEKCLLSSETENVYCKCDQNLCNKGFNGIFEISVDYCVENKCVNGKPVSNADKQTCTCECEEGFSGELCETESFQCPGVGTFPDPKFCWIYYTCSPGATGIDKNTNSCPFKILGTTKLQLVFQYNPDTKIGTCTFPSVFKPYTGQTCSVN
ncbi:hypothetical protein BpHYR1_034027 [Brachionus plicatilis]|uniref:EGF-like domain-containing protein n=1 Tax=Brachionus plicatilis TaxID=10195 RepID=A0A3M7PFA6_BRAPC|nr:hypothetical protein BpHYR1_034027 [Brachionus plicatilis]